MMEQNDSTIAIFGGGCFWCTEAIYKSLKGITSVSSGYAGGNKENPSYGEVCSGETGHAEREVSCHYVEDIDGCRAILSVG